MKKVLFFITAIALCTACNQTAPTISPDKESILRTGSWKLVSGTVTLKNSNGQDTTLNYMPFVTPCHLDDYIKFDSLGNGAVYSGTNLCYASDADSVGFTWRLLNQDNNIDLLNIYNLFDVVFDSIVTPYFFDTISRSPLEFDTLSTSPIVVLDTLWWERFDSTAVTSNNIAETSVNIFNADITNFSQSGFTLSFKWYSVYRDTANGHEGGPPNYAPPILRADTLKYVLNYTNF